MVITGEGKAFSAGGDLQFITDRSTDSPENNELIMRQVFTTNPDISSKFFVVLPKILKCS